MYILKQVFNPMKHMKHILKYIFSKKYRNACHWVKAFEEYKKNKEEDHDNESLEDIFGFGTPR